jgi:hypothetical protein
MHSSRVIRGNNDISARQKLKQMLRKDADTRHTLDQRKDVVQLFMNAQIGSPRELEDVIVTYLIGAGRGRRSTWIDLVCNDSQGFENYYVKAEELMKEIGARPHLGKDCESFNKADLVRVHGDNIRRFLELVDEHDPDGTFSNGFTRRLFGHAP